MGRKRGTIPLSGGLFPLPLLSSRSVSALFTTMAPPADPPTDQKPLPFTFSSSSPRVAGAEWKGKRKEEDRLCEREAAKRRGGDPPF